MHPRDGSTGGWWVRRIPAAVALPPLLYFLLRPESFGLTPNPLDPWFYTGYTANFDDIMAVIGDNYYFVTRWTAYMPGRVTGYFFGPGLGRLVLRWAAASGILLSLWHLGRRWKWTPPAELLIGTIALTTPMFVRALLTDYVEWFSVCAGVLVTTQCLEPRRRVLRSVAIGALAAAIAIANPFSVYLLVAPVAYYVLAGRPRVAAAAVRVGAMVSGGVIVIAAGFVAFRAMYSVPNVYEPTIDFVFSNTGYKDALKSPRLDWMGAYTWIYIPPMLIAFGVFVWKRYGAQHEHARDARVLVALLTTVYALLGLDQFVRDGNGLEISYYWSLAVPTIVVAIGFYLGLWTWTWTSAGLAVGAWWLGLVAARATDVRLPSGVWLVLVGVVAALAVGATARVRPAWATAALLGPVLAAQVFPPAYDPTAYHPYNTHPKYRDLYYRAGDHHDDVWQDMHFALDRLDEIDDTGIFFWQGLGDQAVALAALYGAFVSNHNLYPTADMWLGADSRRLLHTANVQRLAITGAGDAVDAAVTRLHEEFDTVDVLIDARYERDPELRLVAVALDGVRWPRRWLADEMWSLTGDIDGTARRSAAGEPGFVAFSPGMMLEAGSYTATYHVAVDGPPDAPAGIVDAALRESTVTVAAELLGTGGAPGTVTLPFDVEADSEWELRVYSNGEFPLRVESVELHRNG